MTRQIQKYAGNPDAELHRIERRIAGRHAAIEVADLLGDDVEDADFMGALCDTLMPTKDDVAPPAPEPIGRLGATVIPFGQHNGKTFDDVPLPYLDWLCRSQEDFYKGLRAYLRHPELESRRRGLD